MLDDYMLAGFHSSDPQSCHGMAMAGDLTRYVKSEGWKYNETGRV